MKRRYAAIVLLLFAFVACTANLGNVPLDLDVQNWIPEKRANFFMKTWMSEKATYDNMNAIEDKPENIDHLLM